MDEEMTELITELLSAFEMETGYPSLQVHTDDGLVWGVVPDSLGLTLERLWEIVHGED